MSIPPLAARLLAGPLSTTELLSNPHLKLEPFPIMRAKALRQLARGNRKIATDPNLADSQAYFDARSVPAYRSFRRNRAGWLQYLTDYDTTLKTQGVAAAEALPTPGRAAFHLRPTAKPRVGTDYVTDLLQLAERPLHPVGDLSAVSGEARLRLQDQINDNRETSRARSQIDALKLRLIDGDPTLTPGQRAQLLPVLSWAERVVADMQTCERLGRPVPGAAGHALGGTALPLRPSP